MAIATHRRVEVNKYINEEGKVGVLVSGGYGAGWSTWNGNTEFMAMDKTLVAMKLAGDDEDAVEGYCKMVTGAKPYMGGWSGACVEWVDKGAGFRIDEYDGSETLITMADLPLRA